MPSTATPFTQALERSFPGAAPAEAWLAGSARALGSLGFDGPNTIACVGVCRDELAQPLVRQVREIWGEAFDFCSLGGMLFLGRTGFLAAQHHAPTVKGRERYAFFALAHVAIGEDGAVGACRRPGRPEISHACGALCAFRQELLDGRVDLADDPDDLEQVALKRRLSRLLPEGARPDIPDLTMAAHRAIREDLERMVEITVDPARSDYAVLTGIQIHGPGVEHVWPGARYAVVGGERHDLAW